MLLYQSFAETQQRYCPQSSAGSRPRYLCIVSMLEKVSNDFVIHTLLGVDLADISCLQLILSQFRLFLHPLLVALSKADELLHLLYIVMTVLMEVIHLQSLSPDMLVQIHKHVLLQACLAVVDSNAIIVTVETVDQSLNRGLVQVTQVGGCLARLLAHDNSLWLDKAESINDNLALHGLDRIHDDSHRTGSELFEGLLGVDIDRREPAAETRVRVIPSNNSLRSKRWLPLAYVSQYLVPGYRS